MQPFQIVALFACFWGKSVENFSGFLHCKQVGSQPLVLRFMVHAQDVIRHRQQGPFRTDLFFSTLQKRRCRQYTRSLWQHSHCSRLMRFLFVRPRVCLQLPSDSPSPGTPLLFGYALPTTGRARDFHPLDFAHAGRTEQTARLGLDPGRADCF